MISRQGIFLITNSCWDSCLPPVQDPKEEQLSNLCFYYLNGLTPQKATEKLLEWQTTF